MKKLQDKWIVTRKNYKRKEGSYLLSAHICDGIAVDFQVEDQQNQSLLGNIYIGKVQNIVKNINAAFIEIADKQMVYYSLEDNRQHLFVNTKKNNILKIGDEIVIQIAKEGIKTKDPVGTSKLSFAGRYVVLTFEDTKIGVSNKLPKEKKEALREILSPYKNDRFGFIIRTNAADAAPEVIQKEAESLVTECENLLESAMHRTVFSTLKKGNTSVCRNLKNIRFTNETEVITDDRELFTQMENYLEENQPENKEKLRFYKDALLPLEKLYSLDKHLEDALGSRVWLKSGGYLIIQPTEALTVIDVNTGKYDGKKNQEETFFKINMEAAAEIGRQLRIRNLSGIIIIDFISMPDREKRENLIEAFKEVLRQDPVKTTFVDMTGLDLVEITRKKVQKPLYEQLGELCPCCHGNTYLY